jgi:hypothetical protein
MFYREAGGSARFYRKGGPARFYEEAAPRGFYGEAAPPPAALRLAWALAINVVLMEA